jgi:hypothetical protein
MAECSSQERNTGAGSEASAAKPICVILMQPFWRPAAHYVLCFVPDVEAEKHGLIRVIDESGEDYGYSAERFFALDVPHALKKELKGISATRQANTTLKRSSGANSSKAKRAGAPRRSRPGAYP